MEFDIDVSGEDLLSKDYTICIANKDGIIKGFKFSEKLVKDLSSRYGQGFYRYKKSKKGKSDFKIRLYCTTIYYLFKSIKLQNDISLNICRDFIGREDDVQKSINYFLNNKLSLDLCDRIYFCKLPETSNAHKYAYLMREDKRNKLSTYVNIELKDFEKLLKK